jgi:hypothetical protein
VRHFSSSFAAMIARLQTHRHLLAILAVSALLRVVLALQGGQYFFPDEDRYQSGVAIYQALRAGDTGGLREVLKRPEHPAFNYLGAALAALHHALAQLTPQRDWTQEENITASADLAAAVLSLFSVLNIWLVHRLARAGGADENEALWAALLTAAANTLFYYSRHLLPYDCALSAALGGLIFAVSPREGARPAVSGALAALTFGLYNGYWYLVPVILAALVLTRSDWRARWRAGVRWALGFLGALAGLLLPGVIADGTDYLTAMSTFSGIALQGLFGEGWSLPWEYFWYSEDWLGLVVAAGSVFALARAWRPDTTGRRLRRWLLLLAMAYLLPVLAAVWLEKFVVYARTIRPLVPLLCLTGGYALHTLTVWRPKLTPAVVTLIVAGALAHFAPHFGRSFPRAVELQVGQQYGMTKRWLSFTGTFYRPLILPRLQPDLALVDAQFIYPVRNYRGGPAGTVLFSVEHPLAYRPYQYEGHTPRERTLLRSHELRIRLIRLADPATVPYHPPVALLYDAASEKADGYDHRRP